MLMKYLIAKTTSDVLLVITACFFIQPNLKAEPEYPEELNKLIDNVIEIAVGASIHKCSINQNVFGLKFGEYVYAKYEDESLSSRAINSLQEKLKLIARDEQYIKKIQSDLNCKIINERYDEVMKLFNGEINALFDLATGSNLHYKLLLLLQWGTVVEEIVKQKGLDNDDDIDVDQITELVAEKLKEEYSDSKCRELIQLLTRDEWTLFVGANRNMEEMGEQAGAEYAKLWIKQAQRNEEIGLPLPENEDLVKRAFGVDKLPNNIGADYKSFLSEFRSILSKTFLTKAQQEKILNYCSKEDIRHSMLILALSTLFSNATLESFVAIREDPRSEIVKGTLEKKYTLEVIEELLLNKETSVAKRASENYITAKSSGFFITDNGHILTTNRYLKTEEKIEVIYKGASFKPRIIASDKWNNVALLKINVDSQGLELPVESKFYSNVNNGNNIIHINNDFKINRSKVISLKSRDDPRLYVIDGDYTALDFGSPVFALNGDVKGMISANDNAPEGERVKRNQTIVLRIPYIIGILDSEYLIKKKALNTKSSINIDRIENSDFIKKRIRDSIVNIHIYE